MKKTWFETIGGEWGGHHSPIDNLRKYIEPTIMSVYVEKGKILKILLKISFNTDLSIYLSNGILIGFRYRNELRVRKNIWGYKLEEHYKFIAPLGVNESSVLDEKPFAEEYEKVLKGTIVNFAKELVSNKLRGKNGSSKNKD